MQVKMDIYEAMRARHSVRAYEQREIEGGIKDMLEDKIAELNGRSGLHIQLITHEPKAFDSPMAHYGKFSGVTDYIAMIGKKDDELEEKCGYYGEKLVLFAPQLGQTHGKQNGSDAVAGAQRAEQHAAVHIAVKADGGNRRLQHPAEEGITEKEP